jgi:hypothetical protein
MEGHGTIEDALTHETLAVSRCGNCDLAYDSGEMGRWEKQYRSPGPLTLRKPRLYWCVIPGGTRWMLEIPIRRIEDGLNISRTLAYLYPTYEDALTGLRGWLRIFASLPVAQQRRIR